MVNGPAGACSAPTTATYSNYYRVSLDRLLSRCLADLVCPAMDDGVAVEMVEVGKDPGFEFGFGCDADVTQHGSCHLGEEAFDEIEPRPVLRREHEGEAPVRLGSDPSLGVLRYLG